MIDYPVVDNIAAV